MYESGTLWLPHPAKFKIARGAIQIVRSSARIFHPSAIALALGCMGRSQKTLVAMGKYVLTAARYI